MVRKVKGWKLSVVGLLAALLVAGVVQTHGKKEKGRLEVFREKLDQKGFEVKDGSVTFPPVLDMCCQCQLPSCYANNKSSNYGFFALPPATGQTTINPYAEWFDEDGTLDPLPAGSSYWWRMRPDEAAVFLGPTPPPRWTTTGSRPTSTTAMWKISAREFPANANREMIARGRSRIPSFIGFPSSPASGTR